MESGSHILEIDQNLFTQLLAIAGCFASEGNG
jgi:hypothetical protein